MASSAERPTLPGGKWRDDVEMGMRRLADGDRVGDEEEAAEVEDEEVALEVGAVSRAHARAELRGGARLWLLAAEGPQRPAALLSHVKPSRAIGWRTGLE